jgi:succinate dehydrogenase / fumarate reductase, iron-sulfur subunit
MSGRRSMLLDKADRVESRVLSMVATMDAERFGGGTNSGECVSSCPKGIPFERIANLNREFLRAVRNGNS